MTKKRLNFDLILLGDPTSGKDTQAKLLMKKVSLHPVESGKYSRQLAKKNSADGAWLRRTMSLGYPTPVPLIKKFLIAQVNKAPKNKDLIFIGNPKLKSEAQLLTKMLTGKSRDFFVLYIKLTKPEIFKRTKKRGRLKTEDRAVDRRINWHRDQGGKTVKYFRKMNRLKFINGNQSIKKVHKDILEAINDYSRSKRN